MHALRHSTALRLLGVFALLSQLLLPNLHAQDWASRNGNGLLYAFCGTSPALLKQFKAVAPAELVQSLELNERQQAQHGQTSCGFCIGWHGAQLAGAPDIVIANLAPLLPVWLSERRPLAPRWRNSDFAWARGPPPSLSI